MASSDASRTVEIAASPSRVYALVTDLDVLTELADETTAMRWRRGTAAVRGSVFRGSNRNGWHRWTTTCTVTEADAGRCFAFDVTHTGLPIATWRYDVEATDGGCRVTETTTDARPGWFARIAVLATGTSDRGAANAAHIEATLARLKARAEAG